MNTMKQMAHAIRFLSMDAIVRANDGHPGTPLGGADIVTALFTQHLKFDSLNPEWPDRDRFVHSAGHGSMLLYSLLYLTGYEEMGLEQIRSFRVLGSNTPGHPEYHQQAGVETTTGPLGQGIANAVGMAVAERVLNHRFGDDLVDHYTYAYTGDGCLMEGIAAEVIALAGHLKLGKLIFLWDDNRMTDDGVTDQAVSENNCIRFENAGWHVLQVDGHDPEAISAAIEAAKRDDRPSMIDCRTFIGFGIPRIQDDRAAHGGKITREDTDAARQNLSWPHQPFVIPDQLMSAWRQAGSRGAEARMAWEQRLASAADSDREEFKRVMEGRLPEGWERNLLEFKRQKSEAGQPQAGIRASGEVLSLLADVVPELISGAPDLEAATQHKRQLQPFTRDDRGGRYIHYGVREHAMGAMMNGMTVHGGIVPVGTTFLVFSDYLRHALRMAAMMEIPGIFVFSHDSIGIGKNGPTHQPVETLASLRAYPGMWVMRPADAVEMAECWQLAMTHKNGPTSIICSRQPLNVLRTEHVPENRCAKGAYLLQPAEDGDSAAVLIATGSEVAVACEARRLLQEKGVPASVVSMPCWELFEQQDEEYKRRILPSGTVRIAIEAAVRLGWDRYIGEKGGFVGMSSFGASGDFPDLFEHFGITPKSVVAEVEARL